MVDGGPDLTQAATQLGLLLPLRFTFASGSTAEARIIRIVDTISSSTNVKPPSDRCRRAESRRAFASRLT